MQSWCFYRDTFPYEDTGNKISQISAYTTFSLVIDDVRYESDEVIDFASIRKKKQIMKKKKLVNNYRGIIYNKTEEAIKLYDKLDKDLLSNFPKLERNYLIKDTVYYMKEKLVEVYLRQRDIQIVLIEEILPYDLEHKLSIRKGYENNKVKYQMILEKDEDINYIINIFRNYYVDKLNNRIENKIFNNTMKVLKDLSKDYSYINKGVVFKTKRNFALLSERKYGAMIKILDVGENEYFSIVEKEYNPLSYAYKIKTEDDLEKIIPYINKSFELSKYPSIDIKNNLQELYS